MFDDCVRFGFENKIIRRIVSPEHVLVRPDCLIFFCVFFYPVDLCEHDAKRVRYGDCVDCVDRSGACRGRCPDFGCRTIRGQEPLEFFKRGAQGVDRRWTRRFGVYAVSGR